MGIGKPPEWQALTQAVAIIKESVAKGDRLAIWGHDDLDGIASTAIMLDALKGKTEAIYYIPPKHGVHYGLDEKIIDQLINRQVKLLITVDGGISNFDEAEYCRDKGLSLIITDHHELPDRLPRASVVLNPKIGGIGVPYANLAGAGVALFLSEALSATEGEALRVQAKRLAWAALATVSDRVPLLDDNRIILRKGLPAIAGDRELNRAAKLMELDMSRGLSARIIQDSFVGLFSASVSEGFGHPMVEFLSGEWNEEYLSGLWLKQFRWKEELGSFFESALNKSTGRGNGIAVLVEYHLPLDMIGPLAGAVRDSLGSPVVVIGKKGDYLVGECRGYLPFDFVDMMKTMKPAFVQFGGHKQAAGFTIKPEMLDSLVSEIGRYSSEHVSLISDSRPKAAVEMKVDTLDEIYDKRSDLMARAPFGAHNPAPVCRVRKVCLPPGPKRRGYYWLDELTKPASQGCLCTDDALFSIDITHTGEIVLFPLNSQTMN